MKVNVNAEMSAKVNYSSSEPVRAKTAKVDRAVESEVRVKAETVETRNVERDAEKVRQTVEKINKEMENSDTQIQFKVHESKLGNQNKVSIKVIDKQSEKVIIEIPSEEAIEFAEKMDEITGILFDHKG